MGKSRSVTPSNTRIKRDKSSAWPKTATSTAKPAKKKVGFAHTLKRKRLTSPSPTDGSDRADAMSIDKDTDDSDDETAPLDQLHAISIALLDACGTGREGNAQLVEFTRHIHAKAEELELLGDGETAVAAVTSAYCDRIATRLTESLVSEEMLAEVIAMVLKRRAYEMDSKAFLRSLKRKLENTTCTSRDRGVSATLPETPTDSELPEPATIARAVDMYWDRERLGHLDNGDAQALVSSAIKCARDLFIVHQVVDAEFRASEDSDMFDLQTCSDQAISKWAQLSARRTERYSSRYEAVRHGDLRKFEWRRHAKRQEHYRKQYGLRRQPLQDLAPAHAPAPAPVAYVHVKTESASSSRIDPSVPHFITAPTRSHTYLAAINGDRRIPSHTNSEMGERQHVLDRHGNQPAVHIDPAFRRPPPTGPSANGAVLVKMNSVPTIEQMQQMCEQAYRTFGYVSVQRLSRTGGLSEWVVFLRTAGQDISAVKAHVKVNWQLGDIEVYRGDLT
ncbi:hypothetical protein LTR15_009997 [Elasticomyces elasticus]|nr:hypothetical protein LTR15_009997 [Elasticomyces elasticus]